MRVKGLFNDNFASKIFGRRCKRVINNNYVASDNKPTKVFVCGII